MGNPESGKFSRDFFENKISAKIFHPESGSNSYGEHLTSEEHLISGNSHTGNSKKGVKASGYAGSDAGSGVPGVHTATTLQYPSTDGIASSPKPLICEMIRN
jgi:hypothetical protein